MVQYTSPPEREFFNQLVWEVVRQVPVGRVTTYGFVAGLVGPAFNLDPGEYRAWGARWVGGAMAACPENVPWQRVINAQGKISMRPGGGGTRQRELLEAEGIQFETGDRIDLKRYVWEGPGEQWLQAQGLGSPPQEKGAR